MFKIGLENRDFCKSLHIVDAGRKKKKKKKKKNELHLLACSAALGPSGRGHHYFLIMLRGACQRPDMDSQKQLKLCRFPQRTCKLMRLKVVI